MRSPGSTRSALPKHASVFASGATTHVDNDPTGAQVDLFLRDFAANTTQIISVDPSGNPLSSSTQSLYEPAIRDDGRYVTFQSSLPLVDGDANNATDVFVRDLSIGETRLVSVSTEGALGNQRSRNPALMPDVRYIAFSSNATNFDDGDDNIAEDIFIHNRVTGDTFRASDSPSSDIDPDIAQNGLVVWETGGVHEIYYNDVGLVQKLADGENPVVSDDGNCIAYQTPPGVARRVILDCLTPSTLVASILPSSRSVQVGELASVFATIINTGSVALDACRIQPGLALGAAFTYQTTNPVTNELTGAPDTPVSIAAGAAQTFFLAFTPAAPIEPLSVPLAFVCNDSRPAAPLPGINTLLLSSESAPVPDIVALAATSSADGVVRIAGGAGAFAVSTVNVGAGAEIAVTAVATDPALDLTLSLCQTDAAAVCINPSQPTTAPVVAQINAGETPTFSVFAASAESISPDPARRRIDVVFSDTAFGVVRGATSVAVQAE